MIVSEVNKVLKDKTMQNKEANFKLKVKKTSSGGGPKKPSLPQQILIKLEKFIDKQEKNWKEQRKFNKLVIKRLDNIVQKNNLKE